MGKQEKEKLYPNESNDKIHYFGESMYFSDNEMFREMVSKGREWKVGLYLKDEKRD